jgi:hypothetical protein
MPARKLTKLDKAIEAAELLKHEIGFKHRSRISLILEVLYAAKRVKMSDAMSAAVRAFDL